MNKGRRDLICTVLLFYVTEDLRKPRATKLNESRTHAAYAQRDIQETMENNRKFTCAMTDKKDSVRRLTA